MSPSPRALLAALDRLDTATPGDVARLLDSPVRDVRRGLLHLHRAGHVDRALLTHGVPYARTRTGRTTTA